MALDNVTSHFSTMLEPITSASFLSSLSIIHDKTWMALRFHAKITSSCIWVAIPVDRLFDIGMPVVRTDGWAYSHVITKFSRMGRLPHFLPMVLRCAMKNL